MPSQLIRHFFGSLRRRPRRLRPRRPQLTLEALEMRLVMAATLKAPISDMTLATNQQTTHLDLLKHMQDDRINGTVTKWTTTMGTFYVDLFDNVTPMTVQNFLNYVHAGAYNQSFFHRSVLGVLQGGGFQWTGSDDAAIDPEAPIPNEFQNLKNAQDDPNTPVNVRGTLAMAKMSPPSQGGPFNGGPHSATSQWFFNLRNNASNFDYQNGGFTTFGRVLGDGMDVIDTIASLPRYDSPNPITGGAFTDVPLRNYTPGSTVTSNNVPLIQSIQVVPELNFSIVSNSNSGLVQATIDSKGRLQLQHQGNLTGSATITVRGTDLFGEWVEDTFVVTYANGGNRAPTVIPPGLQDINTTEKNENRTYTTDLATIFTDSGLGHGDRLLLEVVSNSNPRLVTAGLNGTTLVSNVYAYENGQATITVRATDLSGAYVEDTFVISVSAVNNAPMALGNLPNLDRNEDAAPIPINTSQIGLFTDYDLFTNTDELTISVSKNDNPSVISSSVSGTVVTFTPVANANGYATVRIRATDKAGAYAEVEFRITIHAVNDAPSFDIASSHHSPAGGGLQTVPNFATNISRGPANESDQTLTFEIVSNSNPSLFKTPPSISANGTLTYELVGNRMEVAQITVRLKDSGGTIRSGSDTSGTRTFLISAGNPWQNPNNRFDIDGINGVNGFDFLALANEIRNPQYSDRNTRRLPMPRATSGAPYFDVDGVMRNGSLYVDGFDVLELANYLRSPARNQSAPLSTNNLPSSTSEQASTAPVAAPLTDPVAETSFTFTTDSPAPQGDVPASEPYDAGILDARILMGLSTFTAEPFTGVTSDVVELPRDEEPAGSLAANDEVFDNPELFQADSEVSLALLEEQLRLSGDESEELAATAHDAVFTEFAWK